MLLFASTKSLSCDLQRGKCGTSGGGGATGAAYRLISCAAERLGERSAYKRLVGRVELLAGAISVAMLSSGPAAVSALAQGDSNSANPSTSLDSLWVDQAASGAAHDALTQSHATPSHQEQSTGTAMAVPSAPAAADTLAPMCKLGAFKDSTLVTKGGWPGVGPFKQSGADADYADDAQNRLHLDLQGDQISRAELTLKSWQPSKDPVLNVLNLQMNVDFLLEALGIKSGRTHEFNDQIEKKRDVIFSDGQPVSIVSGRYEIGIQRDGSGALVLTANSLDANRNAIKQAAKSETPPIAQAPAVVVQPPVTPAHTVSSNRSELKTQFADLITKWQQVKQKAVRNRQTEQLDAVLAGKALTRQVNAINWLVQNHRYYEMDPKTVVVDRFTEILPGKKYMVAAQVREAYKYIDEQSNKMLKSVDDTNLVDYTVEKLGGKWVITDSALLSAGDGHKIH